MYLQPKSIAHLNTALQCMCEEWHSCCGEECRISRQQWVCLTCAGHERGCTALSPVHIGRGGSSFAVHQVQMSQQVGRPRRLCTRFLTAACNGERPGAAYRMFVMLFGSSRSIIVMHAASDLQGGMVLDMEGPADIILLQSVTKRHLAGAHSRVLSTIYWASHH